MIINYILTIYILALQLKEIDYEYKAVHLVKNGGEQHMQDYRAINPMEQVPALDLGNGQVITQSLAIMEYLEEQYTGKCPLFPNDNLQRARVREISEAINAGTQPLQNLSVINKYSVDAGARKEWSQFWIEKGLKVVESLLATSAGDYCVGNQISMADCCLVPQVYNANRFGVDMSQFPIINRILQLLEKNEAFIAAHPDTQPDKPE